MQFDNPPVEMLYNPSSDAAQLRQEKRPVFWFERQNGECFCTEEKDAWALLKGRSKVRNAVTRVKYLGRSSGEVYFSGLVEMKEIFKTKGMTEAQEFLRKLENKERETADTSVAPRNQDIMGDVSAMGGSKISI